ncbi:response regulator, partial [Vibrio parahaemolyticus 861]
SVV